MQSRKHFILISLFLLILIFGCARQASQQTTEEEKSTKSMNSREKETEDQLTQGPQPIEPVQAVPPPIEYPKITNETSSSTLQEECNKKSWPEYCTWIPEPDGRVLCEKHRLLRDKTEEGEMYGKN